MRKLTVVLVAAMILLAGCSGGGGGAASPTEDSEMNATATGTGNGNSTSGDVAPQSAVSDDNTFSSATEIDGTWYNGSQQSSALIRNDTSNDRKLTEYTDESGTTSELYTTEDYVAVRNGTTGDVQYGGPDSFIGPALASRVVSPPAGPSSMSVSSSGSRPVPPQSTESRRPCTRAIRSTRPG